jgi:pimeloyl-ACP methyl ester carboxylesterase
MKAYLIPGLGTDHRIFKNLASFLPFDEIIYLDFNEELIGKSAGMKEYAAIVAADIDKENPVVFIGLSLGGILAGELSRLLPKSRLILISSIKTEQEAPSILKIARKVPLYKFVPVWFSRNIVPLLSRLAKVTDKEGYYLYREMLKGWSAKKFRWARHSAVNWNNRAVADCLHIHGTRDHIFPHKKIKNAILINNGSHYMIMDRAEEIAEIIRQKIKI